MMQLAAEIVAQLSSLEIAFAYSKMRARKTPGNQAHVTNAKDDPLQMAAEFYAFYRLLWHSCVGWGQKLDMCDAGQQPIVGYL